MESYEELPWDWAPDETVVVYEVSTGEGPEEVAGHRVGDFVVRHLFADIVVEDPDTGASARLRAGHWVVDHLPSRTMIFFHSSRHVAAFVADNFAAHFEGYPDTSSLVAAAEPVQDWVLVSVRAYERGMRPCSLNAWLRTTLCGEELLRYLPAARPQVGALCDRLLAGLPEEEPPGYVAAGPNDFREYPRGTE